MIERILNFIKDKKQRKSIYIILIAAIVCNFADLFVSGLFLFILAHNHFDNFFDVFSPSQKLSNIPVSIKFLSASIGEFTFIICNYISCIKYTSKCGNVARNKTGFIKFVSLYLISYIFSQLINLFLFTIIQLFWIIKLIKIIPTSIIGSYIKNKYIFNIKILQNDENIILL